MPVHKFGIMGTAPGPGERYDCFEPEKYGCITVDDELLLPLLSELKRVSCYWHSLDRPNPGLAYYGITLIPPESLGEAARIIQKDKRLGGLLSLLSEAGRENKFVIHFGI